MAILAQDTFQRANQSGWGTASDGETWTFTGHSSTNSIAGNEGVIQGNGDNDTHAQLGTNTATDQEILCRLATNDNPVAAWCGIQARFSSASGTSCYRLLYTNSTIYLNKTVSGSLTTLTNAAFTMTLGVFYWFRLRCVGSSVYGKIWQDGTSEPSGWTLTATDSSVTSGGFAVIAGTNNAQGVQFDHFIATNGTTRVIAPNTTALQSTSTRSIPALSALQGTQTRTIPGTTSLVSTAVSTNAVLMVRAGTAPLKVRE